MSFQAVSITGSCLNNRHVDEYMSYDRRRQSDSVRLLLIALLSLLLGVLVYSTARAPGTTGFLPAAWNVAIPWPHSILALTGSLPTFFHTLAFCLLLSLIAGAGLRATRWVCTIWLMIETAFEVGQYHLFSSWIAKHLSSWFASTWLQDHIGPYFITGVFDPFDLIAAAAGAILALTLVALMTPKRRHRHERCG